MGATYSGYQPLSSLDHSKDERDAHRIHWLEGEVGRLEAIVQACAADTTSVELRQQIEFVRSVLDRFEEINAAREMPSQMVTDLISDVRYQLGTAG